MGSAGRRLGRESTAACRRPSSLTTTVTGRIAWSALGSGVQGEVDVMAAFDDDGSGPHPAALYVAGQITAAGGAPAGLIGRWDDASWSTLGNGMRTDNNGRIRTLMVADED